MRGFLTGAALGFSLVALAVATASQAQQPAPTPEVVALSNKVMAELNAGLQCAANVVKLEAEVKDLKAKLAEKEKTP